MGVSFDLIFFNRQRHFESSRKLQCRHMWILHCLAQAIVITRRVGSLVLNVNFNRQSPVILCLYPSITYL